MDSLLNNLLSFKQQKLNYNPFYYKNQVAKLGIFRRATIRDLVNFESQLGATIFGQTPPGHRREFFILDENTWIWHESWVDQSGFEHKTTTRYEVYPDRIIKILPGPKYQQLSDSELDNFKAAVNLYYKLILGKIYTPNL